MILSVLPSTILVYFGVMSFLRFDLLSSIFSRVDVRWLIFDNCKAIVSFSDLILSSGDRRSFDRTFELLITLESVLSN